MQFILTVNYPPLTYNNGLNKKEYPDPINLKI